MHKVKMQWWNARKHYNLMHWNLRFNEMLENYEYVKYQQDGNYILYQYDNIEIVEVSVFPGPAK